MRKSKKKELTKHLKRNQRDQKILKNPKKERTVHIIEKAKKTKSQVNQRIQMIKTSALLNHLENEDFPKSKQIIKTTKRLRNKDL